MQIESCNHWLPSTSLFKRRYLDKYEMKKLIS